MDYIFITKLFTNPSIFFMIALTIVFSVCLHEYFHAQAALWEGDSTAADSGHLTLNPLKQMGVISIVMFCLMGICWGSVPTDPRNFRSRWSELRVALAGPLANFLLFAAGWAAYGFLVGRPPFGFLVEHPDVHEGLITFAYIFGLYNFVLLVLNLIPLPGLDGWTAVRTIFPAIARPQSEMVKGFMIFAIIIVLLFINYLYWAGKIAMAVAERLLA